MKKIWINVINEENNAFLFCMERTRMPKVGDLIRKEKYFRVTGRIFIEDEDPLRGIERVNIKVVETT